MNNVEQSGILGKVPELTKTKTGKSVVNFTIAVYDGKDESGKPKTQWIKWQAWDYNAEKIAKAHSGDTIICNGMQKRSAFQNEEGKTMYNDFNVVREIFIQPKRGSQSQDSGETYEEVDTSFNMEENLPF